MSEQELNDAIEMQNLDLDDAIEKYWRLYENSKVAALQALMKGEDARIDIEDAARRKSILDMLQSWKKGKI